MRKLLGVLGVITVVGIITVITVVQAMTSTVALSAAGGGGNCQAYVQVADIAGGGAAVSLDAGQRGNAAIILQVGAQLQVGPYGEQVAVATAMQESTLHNLDHGDRDSVGLFQQRPSQGWGSVAQIMDPQYAAQQFYSHLQQVPGWQQMPLWEAAQAVQRSGFPLAYQKWADLAAQLVQDGGGASLGCTNTGPASDRVEAAIAAANLQLGKPYVWGATGPDSFDCSGLMLRAWGAAGVTLPRTSPEQWTAGTPVPLAAAQRGDLLFWAYDRNDPGSIHHVAMYLGNGQIIEAQQDGVPVHIRAVRLDPAEPELMPEAIRVRT